MRTVLSVLLSAALLGGCAGGADTPPAAVPADTHRATAGAPADTLAATRPDTLLLEGMPEPVTLRLYRSPEGAPLAFHTYVPPDLAVRDDSAASGVVRFVAAFGGTPRDDVNLKFQALPGLDEAAATEKARVLGGSAASKGRYEWARAEYDLSKGDRVGRLMLGEHGGAWFLLQVSYPSEFAEGFGPRAAMVLRHWRWEDGAPLGR